MTVVDCRGLLCPEPVLRVKRELERLSAGETLEVLVDNPAARDNVSRMAKSLGWTVSALKVSAGGEFHLRLTRAPQG